MKWWDILQNLWESYSGIRVHISPFGALSVTSNSGDRSYNLLLFRTKDHKSNCCSLWLLKVKHSVWRHQLATQGLDWLRMWLCGHSSLWMVLFSPVHHVIPQLWDGTGRRTSGQGRRGESCASLGWCQEICVQPWLHLPAPQKEFSEQQWRLALDLQ